MLEAVSTVPVILQPVAVPLLTVNVTSPAPEPPVVTRFKEVPKAKVVGLEMLKVDCVALLTVTVMVAVAVV